MFVLAQPPASLQTSSQLEFADIIDREFMVGSGISRELYQVATRTVSDIELLSGGEAIYPIHEALNWSLSRFSQQVRSNFQAVLLLNEDQTCWQAKLSTPRQNAQAKIQKYETPVGNGARAFLPTIPASIRQLVSDRYGIPVPMKGSFWTWLEAHPEIPIISTEGGKKALALLSQGYVALALYGVNGGYRRLLDGSRCLIPDVTRFAVANRLFILGFDQDVKVETQQRVAIALHRFGQLLTQSSCSVRVATWLSDQGKGVDDLIVSQGVTAWDHAYTQALPLEHWRIWQHLEQRLTYPAAVNITTADLSTLLPSEIPIQGLIAIASAKGTGKTNWIGGLVQNSERVLAGGHRIALMRNLAVRLGLDYKGDIDKINGAFISGCAYTYRIGLCVDSLLAIDPEKFAGCDLILDEAVQVIRHLLTSNTCARDGKRPALLARLRELIRVARRVIIADADLDNATLDYLQALRGQAEPIFLIRNHYQPNGYPVRFIESPDRSAIISELITATQNLVAGKVLFVATDSKSTSKAIAHLLAKQSPKARILLINSETSNGEQERQFIQTPDIVLSRHEYDIILCSPSVATGISIETQGIITGVYGIFMGSSSTDADMAQALGRVREPVERFVWCAKQGSNFSKVSRTTHFLEFKNHLQQRTSATIQLIRSGLREDYSYNLETYNWQSDSHLHLYCKIAVAQNSAMYHLRTALQVRLQHEGHKITLENRASETTVKSLMAASRQEQRILDAEDLITVASRTHTEILELEQKEDLSREESLAITKFYFQEFYGLTCLSLEDVLWDNNGRRRGEILNLEAQLFPGVEIDRTVRSLEKQVTWNQGYCPWDISGAELRRWLRSQIGLDELLKTIQTGKAWCKYDLKSYAEQARVLKSQIKVVLHFTITKEMSDTQIIHQLLSQLGIKLIMRWSQKVSGHEGEKLRTYTLDQNHWTKIWEILQKRQSKRQQLEQKDSQHQTEIVHNLKGSPLEFNKVTSTGDPQKKVLQKESNLSTESRMGFPIFKSYSLITAEHEESIPFKPL